MPRGWLHFLHNRAIRLEQSRRGGFVTDQVGQVCGRHQRVSVSAGQSRRGVPSTQIGLKPLDDFFRCFHWSFFLWLPGSTMPTGNMYAQQWLSLLAVCPVNKFSEQHIPLAGFQICPADDVPTTARVIPHQRHCGWFYGNHFSGRKSFDLIFYFHLTTDEFNRLLPSVK